MMNIFRWKASAVALVCLVLLAAGCAGQGPGTGDDLATSTPDDGIGNNGAPQLPTATQARATGPFFAEATETANCRPGPGFEYGFDAYLMLGERAQVLGRVEDNSWFLMQLEGEPEPCWVSTLVLVYQFDPDNIALVPIPSTPMPGSIGGVLWHEICQFTGGQGGQPIVLGLGCVEWGAGAAAGDFGPNQIYDAFESGWSGVTLHLGMGACPSTGLATAVTNGAGAYSFGGLPSGTYCVSYSNLTDGNDSILIPGGPTYPARGSGGFYQTIILGAAENLTNVNFGYAWQFFN